MFQEYEIITCEDIVRSIGGRKIQKGMNYNVKDKYNIFLINTSKTALYSDQIEESGTAIYEGHNVPKTKKCPYPNKVDQPERIKMEH